MAKPHWIIYQAADGWHVAQAAAEGMIFLPEVPLAADRPEEAAAAIAQLLGAHGYSGEAVLVALDSLACLAADFELEAGISPRDSSALGYALEEHLPLASEECAVDFLLHNRHVLGVAVELAPLLAFVEALENSDVVVDFVVPAALLAAAYYQAHGEHASYSGWLGFGDDRRFELFRLDQGVFAAWHTMPADPETVSRRLQMIVLDQVTVLSIQGVNLPPPLAGVLGQSADYELTLVDAPPAREAAVSAADQILRGVRAPLLDLRRHREMASDDPLRPIRVALQATAVSVLLFLVTLCVALYWRTAQHEQLVRQIESRQAELFRQVLPGQPIPIGVRSRLESELVRVRGLRGPTGEMPKIESALTLARDALLAVPEEMRLRLEELHIQNGTVFLDAEALTHGDAERLATALREAGFRVEAPRSQQASGGSVSLQLAAVRQDE